MKNPNYEPVPAHEAAIGLVGKTVVEEIEKAGLRIMWNQDWDEVRHMINGIIKCLDN